MSQKVLNLTSQIIQALKEGQSYRTIAKRFGISRGTITNIKNRFESCKIGGEELQGLSPEDFRKALYPKPTGKAEPVWLEIDKKLNTNKHATLRLLYEFYCEQADGEVYSYANFCRLYREWKKRNKDQSEPSRHEQIPAEKLEIDYSGDKLPWIDEEGKKRHAHLFVAALPYSNLLFALATSDEKRRSWIIGINEALKYFGGVPKLLVFDNSKALVAKPRRRTAGIVEEAIVVPEIELLTEQYGMKPYACNIRSPKSKNRVEAAVSWVQRGVIGRLTLKDGIPMVKDLSALNELVLDCVNKINEQPMSGSQPARSRRQIFEEEEKPLLGALPDSGYYSCQWSVLKVDKTGCIKLPDAHRYSVPKAYIGQSVVVGAGYDEVLIYEMHGNHELICKHKRCTDRHGVKTHLLRAHMSEKEKYTRLSADQYIDEYVARGINRRICELYVEACWAISRSWARLTLNNVRGLFKLHSVELMELAMIHCLNHHGYGYKRMKQAVEYVEEMKRRQLQLPIGFDENYKTVEHENIRNDYE